MNYTNLERIPQKGTSKEELFGYMKELKQNDTKWHEGKTFCLVYDGGPEISEVLKTAYNLYMSENGLNPSAFPSLKKFENDIVSMMARHLRGDLNVSGTMTSGGTESILMAVKAAREFARANRPEIKTPNIVMPVTAHPAFNKACHYFGLEIKTIEVGESYRAIPLEMEKAIDENTILLVASAPSYAHGVIDPIEEISKMAFEKKLLFHVDACIGGMILPLFRKLGHEVVDFDFKLEGVTSMSVDLHKYAYASKGASVVLYRNAQLRRHQFFATTNWPGGMYVSPSMAGTRAGGAIAAAWAVMNYLGEEGYLALAKTIKYTVDEFVRRVDLLDGIELAAKPDSTLLCLTSKELDIYQIGDEMGTRGWYMDRQQFPSGLHLTLMAGHAKVIDQFFLDLEESIHVVRTGFSNKISNIKTKVAKTLIKGLPNKMVSKIVKGQGKNIDTSDGPVKKSAAMYGMMEAIDDRGDLKELLLNVFDKFFTPQFENGSEKKVKKISRPSPKDVSL